ncbi:MAG: MOSC domain-containing protein [Saprospiraceae bacterium]|nr:MOSC domain-containing protein [Saprospiraceae bacterium]
MKVIALYVYPIKGMKGSSVDSVEVEQRGFEHDRRYMLIDERGTFISQRTHPILVNFKPVIKGDDLVVNYKNETLKLSLAAKTYTTVQTTIFEHAVPATEVSTEANMWFSKILGQSVRLVKMEKNNVRIKKLIKGPESVEVSFADGYPYLILGSESLNRLNEHLEKPLDYDRFRANIIVQTMEAHVEDTWEDVSIGSSKLMVVKPCARCPVVTIDQESGLRSKEPLRSLATYRKEENKVYFGANAISRINGLIRIGDEVIPL